MIHRFGVFGDGVHKIDPSEVAWERKGLHDLISLRCPAGQSRETLSQSFRIEKFGHGGGMNAVEADFQPLPALLFSKYRHRAGVGLFRIDSTAMKTLLSLASALVLGLSSARGADGCIVYQPKEGSDAGKHIVFLAGDEEYRSEEGLPMLAKILSQRHGFKCTVLFSIDPDGTISPNNSGSLGNPAALDSADAIVMLLRFRRWDDVATKKFAAAFHRGVPIIALRTSTHAFNYPKESPWAKWTWTNKDGGFGKQVLGETWVSHWAKHKKEATRGVIEESAKGHPILRGVTGVFGDTDVYEAYPPADAKILLRGQALTGMNPTDPPADYKKKTKAGIEQGINDPMMAVAWTREFKNEAGTINKIMCTTMGSATDLQSEGLRRLIVNSVYWALGVEVPDKADVAFVDPFVPTMYGFNGYKKGVKPDDLAIGK